MKLKFTGSIVLGIVSLLGMVFIQECPESARPLWGDELTEDVMANDFNAHELWRTDFTEWLEEWRAYRAAWSQSIPLVSSERSVIGVSRWGFGNVTPDQPSGKCMFNLINQ